MLDGYLSLVPVIGVGVVLHDGLGGEVGQYVGSVVKDTVLVHLAEIGTLGLEELAVDGHVGVIGEHGIEIGDGTGKGVLEDVVALCLNAYLGKIGDFAGKVFRGIINKAGYQIIELTLLVQHELHGVDPVLGLYVGIDFQVTGHPLDALADIEGPDRLVGVGTPALGQGGPENTVLVVFDEAVNKVDCVLGRGLPLAFQVVEGPGIAHEDIYVVLRFGSSAGESHEEDRYDGCC